MAEAFYQNSLDKFNNTSGDEWLAIASGLGKGRNWQEGMSAAATGLQESRRNKAKNIRQTSLDKAQAAAGAEKSLLQKAQIRQADASVAAGKWKKLSTNAMYNTDTKETVYADPAKVNAYTASGSNKANVAQPPVYDEAGNLWQVDYNKNTGDYEFMGPDGKTQKTPPPGMKPTGDSIYGEQGKIDKAMIMDLETTMQESRKSLQSATRSLDILQKPDMWTGVGAETVASLKSAMVSTGFASQSTIDQVADADEFRTLSFEFVMQQVAGTKGAVSDREMQLFALASPGLQKTTQGNQRILEGIALISERKQQEYNFINSKVRTGMPGWVAQQEWADYIKANPIFTKEWFAKTDSAKAAAATEATPADLELDAIRKELESLGTPTTPAPPAQDFGDPSA